MTLINNRNSVLAIMPESAEGTPVAPNGTGVYTALQDDFTMDPAFAILENAELKGSLGKAKSILGAESPTASFSHYLRHSGTEGAAPDYNELLKAAFGTEVVASTEYDTVADSTVALVKMDTGDGAHFQRGQAILVKHSDKAWEIRPVHSVSTDDLVPGFNLTNAPAAGVNTGKCVLYPATNTGHQTLTLWHYLGNTGALQAMAGVRPTSLSIEFAAGELINASMDLEGVEYFFDPITVTASSKYIDFTDDQGTVAAIIPPKTYKDPHDLASAITSAMNAVTTETIACTYDDATAKFTIATSTSTLFSLLWKTGTNTANNMAGLLGYDKVTADDTTATTYTSDTALTFVSPYTPALDSTNPLAAKDNLVMIGDAANNTAFAASSISFNMSLDKKDLDDVNAVSGKSGSLYSGRAVTISVSALLNAGDADKFRRFRENDETRFCYVFGTKSGGNWEAGKCGCLYVPTATVTKFNVTNDEGLVALEMELESYVGDDGLGEVYLSFV